MKKLLISQFNIGLFDGADGAAAAGAESGGEVVYGKQPENQDVKEPVAEVHEPTPEELRAKYDEFMSDENNRKFYQEDTQKVINRRFRETKADKELIDRQNEVLSRLYDRYKVDDLDRLEAAIDNDTAIWEKAADEAGMTVEQYKSWNNLQRERDRAEREKQAAEGYIRNLELQRQREEQYSVWLEEANQLKQEYPEFDLRQELQNRDFAGLIGQKNPQYSISMKQAYELIHPEAVEKRIAERTTQQVTDNIKARGMRPSEGAVGSQGGITVKSDVTKLTKKDRAEIAKRAARGERITF